MVAATTRATSKNDHEREGGLNDDDNRGKRRDDDRVRVVGRCKLTRATCQPAGTTTTHAPAGSTATAPYEIVAANNVTARGGPAASVGLGENGYLRCRLSGHEADMRALRLLERKAPVPQEGLQASEASSLDWAHVVGSVGSLTSALPACLL